MKIYEWSLQAIPSLPRLPRSRLLSRTSRASTCHDIPQKESLLAGYLVTDLSFHDDHELGEL